MHFGNHTATYVKDRGTPSVMQTFTRGTLVGGKQWKFNFPNGFGASVINDGYGREAGRFELAVFGPDDHITYDTPITDDVLGHLTEEEVAEALDRIAAPTSAEVEAAIVRRANEERDKRIAELREELAALESAPATAPAITQPVIPTPTDLRSEGKTYLLMLLYFNVVCGVPVDAVAWREAFGQAADYQQVVEGRRELGASA